MRLELKVDGKVFYKEFMLVSHRGGKGFGPENTLQSLQGALDFGVEMIETDVRMSEDGVPVIQHSPFIGLRLLSRMRMEEIRERAPHIPTLHEYLALGAGRCAMNLEIKKCDVTALRNALAAAKPAFPILVSSFDADFLEEFGQTGVDVEIGLLTQYELSNDRMLKDAERCGAAILLPASFTVREALVAAAREAHLEVITWTVNSRELLEEMIVAGVDGVITDSYPEIKRLLESGMMEEHEIAAPQAAEIRP